MRSQTDKNNNEDNACQLDMTQIFSRLVGGGVSGVNRVFETSGLLNHEIWCPNTSVISFS